MGRRGETKATGGQQQCPSCNRRLPRSAFTRIELGHNGAGRCRDCCARTRCQGCSEWLLPQYYSCSSDTRCKRCRGNVEVDKLLQTPKDEVTHFGPLHVLRLAREAEYALLLALNRKGLYEEMLLRRIVAFLRVPFVTTQNGVHYCELCDHSVPECPVTVGQKLKMAISSKAAPWAGCPFPSARLMFFPGESHTVVEACQGTDGSWFFKTQVKARGKPASEEPAGGPLPQFVALWAPVAATEIAGRPTPLAQHLATTAHKSLEESIVSGEKMLVHRAALTLSKKLGERPGISMSRFGVGLGISDRFCSQADVDKARRLERVRDAEVPLKFLREYFESLPKSAWKPNLGVQGELLWLPPEKVVEAQDAYEQHGRRGGGKKSGAGKSKKSGRSEDTGADFQAEVSRSAKGPGGRRKESAAESEAAATRPANGQGTEGDGGAADVGRRRDRRRAATGSSSDGVGATEAGYPRQPESDAPHPLVASRQRTASGTLIW